MLLNLPFTRDLQEIQRNLEKLIMSYLKISFNPYLDIIHDYEHYHIHMDKIVYLKKCQRVTDVYKRQIKRKSNTNGALQSEKAVKGCGPRSQADQG